VIIPNNFAVYAPQSVMPAPMNALDFKTTIARNAPMSAGNAPMNAEI
jgi:hypothetical protein